MLWVYTTQDAAREISRRVDSLMLQLPGDHASLKAVRLVRSRVRHQAVRKYHARHISIVPVLPRTGEVTVFLVRRCPPPARYSSSLQAEVFLACTVGGLSRRQAAEKFGLPHSTVTEFVHRMLR
jgi:hypothetical protein